ncbi:MAG: hypothetical protein J2P36_02850 [Ktedonobacteraceae bacterium]|nr:hypothetical protein [Ktedonobacteraceae bacterium]
MLDALLRDHRADVPVEFKLHLEHVSPERPWESALVGSKNAEGGNSPSERSVTTSDDLRSDDQKQGMITVNSEKAVQVFSAAGDHDTAQETRRRPDATSTVVKSRGSDYDRHQRYDYSWPIPDSAEGGHRSTTMLGSSLTQAAAPWAAFHFDTAGKLLARREYNVPMLIGRFDAIVDKQGNIQICELDDVCSLWPLLPHINPIAETYFRTLEEQMGLPIYTAELFQYTDGPSIASPRIRRAFAQIPFDEGAEKEQANQSAFCMPSTPLIEQKGIRWCKSQQHAEKETEYYEQLLQRFYAHNEDHWHGDIHEAWLLERKRFSLDEVALSVRAYSDMPGFTQHLDWFGPRSITMAWERDSKWPLIPEKLAVLAANLDIAAEFGKQWQSDHPGDLLVFKTLYSARTEHTAIFSSRGTKGKGVSSKRQIEKKFGEAANSPIIIQPYKEPDHLAEAGIQFIGTADENMDPQTITDRKLIRSAEHIGNPEPGERIIAGMEEHFAMIFRSFVIYSRKKKGSYALVAFGKQPMVVSYTVVLTQ